MACWWPRAWYSPCGTRVSMPRAPDSIPTRSGTWASTGFSPLCCWPRFGLSPASGAISPSNPREIFSSATLESGGTFYGGLLGAILAILPLRLFSEDARAAADGRLRRRIPPRTCHRAPGMFRGRLLLRQAHDASVGRHVHQRSGRAHFRHSARHAAPSHATLRVRRRVS